MRSNTSESNQAQIHVVLVEDDVNFQGALIMAIETAPDMVLRAMASTRAQGLQMLAQVPADVLLVDLGLPDGSGIDVIRQAHERWPTCNIMVCTTFGDEAHVLQSIEAGAAGYLLKDSTPQNMVAEIRSLHAGGSPISPQIARHILMRFRGSPQASAAVAEPREPAKPRVALSDREQEVLEYITKGFTTPEIAALMSVSTHTVISFVRRIYAKLEVHSRTEAVYEARSQGLLP